MLEFTGRPAQDPAVQGRPGGGHGDGAHGGEARQRHAGAGQLHACARTPQGWKAWDVTIEGISYVKNFRTDFGAEIDAEGPRRRDPAARGAERGSRASAPAAKAAGQGRMMAGSFAIERPGPGRLEASGELGFATAAAGAAGRAGADPPRGSACAIDLARRHRGDSAGLAVLVEWLAAAQARGTLGSRYESVPAQILAVARISDLEELLLAQPAERRARRPSAGCGGAASAATSSASSPSSESASSCSSGSQRRPRAGCRRRPGTGGAAGRRRG